MARKSAVRADDRGRVDEVLEALLLAGADAGTSQMGSALVSELELRAEAGDSWAESILRAFSRDGADEYARAWLDRRDRGSIKIASNGRVIDIPARVGVPARSSTGVREPYFQRPLWWELSWAEFEAHIASLRAQIGRLDVNLTGKLQVLALRDRHPDTLTPGEACEREGIDPQRFASDAG